ncbi:MAG: RNA 2'-phosphotransferase [Victivallales bacterium]|jgi:putative RNA 2'-phosphotransferase|nr:RNA 2'-phosphotransferase [Victivallales bacterium]MBT7163920.1 RNA 2'-phosphotransferase [Victivallales bacterium]MBT7298507.1 RNA 2'-phosphotransferase [Victivallales bacterium]
MNKRLIKTSKFLSLVLRHKPGTIGLVLDEQGWASVEELITAAGKHGRELSRELIREVVATSDKQRFALSEDGSRIRANQGHSVKVDLGLEPVTPPEVLFHGTATRFLPSIQAHGLKPSGRHHVHLSGDVETAVKVGSRHGKPIVLRVAAARMHAEGAPFYVSENGVWLTDHVQPAFFAIVSTDA